jgi:hypothetical protein
MDDWFFSFIQCMDEKNQIYMFYIYITSIKIMDDCFILSLNPYQWNFFSPSFN